MMAEDKFVFNIISVNARGLNERKKRRNLFRWVKKNAFDICFVQETYSTGVIEHIWRNEWGGNIIFSHGSSHSRGVMILIKPGFDAKIIDVHTDNIGRFVLADVCIQDANFKLVNVYAPNYEDDQINFYRHLRRQISLNIQQNDRVLLGGDLNFVMNPALDRAGGVPIKSSPKRNKILQYLQDIMSYCEMKDIWREKNPHLRRYTWRRKTPLVKSRLDYWLTSEQDCMKEVDIIPFQHTDHSAIILKVESVHSRGRGRGLWRLNTSFLKEEPFLKNMIEMKMKWSQEFEDVTDPRVKWELIKYRIRQASMEYGKLKARTMKKTEQEIEEKLKQLEAEQDQATGDKENELHEQINEIKANLEEIIDYKTQGLILRSQTNWYEKGEKSTKYFLQLEARNKIKKTIRKLQRVDGTFTTCEKEILEMQKSYYEQLYSARHLKTTDEMKEYADNIITPGLSEEERSECEGPLTALECMVTLKTFKPNKAPGNDGLPIEFYQKLWPIFGKFALDSFNYAHDHGEMSVSQRQATITLLDKGKDRNQLKNWRPISLLNTDYKIMSKALANRFTKHLPKLINASQTGFVKGRNISENIRTLSDIMEYLKDNSQPGILINIDFEKAFDSLNWNFMEITLNKFNFGPSFTQWVKTLYNNISSCIINNGHTSKFFPVCRGVRQGDPLSPYLFILVTEMMAAKIRQANDIKGFQVRDNEYKVLQYADDTSGVLHDLKSARIFLDVVGEFGKYSGLNLNVEKTEGMWLGSNRYSQRKPLGIAWPDRPIRILGIFFSYDEAACEQLNYIDRIDKAQRITNMWMGRNLTLYGRSQIIKTFIMSQFTYAASSISVPPRVIKMVNKLIFTFMWRNKTERIKRTVLMNTIANGGLKVPDFQTMLNVARVKWISKIQSDTITPWKLILEDYLGKCNIHLNILLYSNFSVKTMGLDTTVLPVFYKELLQMWSDIGNTMPVKKHNFLWYNKDICINRRSLYYDDLFTAGAWYIEDLYQNNGTPVPFETWIARGVSRKLLIKWVGLIRKTRQMRVYGINSIEGQQLSVLSKEPLMYSNSKQMYSAIIAEKYGQSACIPRISKYLDNDNIDWKEMYLRANEFPVDTKTKEFQFRFLHDVLANRYWLHKWNMAESAMCEKCTNEDVTQENIAHMFWECNDTQKFWKEFVDFWESNGKVMDLNKKNVLLGVSDKFTCCVIFSAKLYIYNKRTHNEDVHISGYKGYVNKQKRVEFQMAKENNRMEDWIDKWANIITQ